MLNGWIKIHRKLIDWEWYKEPNTFRLFIHLLLVANHKPKNYKGILVDAGQIITSPDKLAKELDLSISKIRTSLKRLKLTNEITIKTNNKGSIIQVVKYEDYQVVANDLTNKSQTNDKPMTTNKNDNKEKNEIKEDIIKNVVDLKNDYLQNDRLINAFCKGQNTTKEKVIEKLTEFNQFLEETNNSMRTFGDYSSHFRNWFKKKSISLQNNNKTKLTF